VKQEGNRGFTARSVLASTLLGEDPPELPVAHLVHMASLFGVSENRARVALSRMVAAGEASTDGSGNYRLAGHLLDRQMRQTESRTGRAGPWSGRWAMAVVRVAGRSAEERAARRDRLARARLAERREGVWLRPDNLELRPDPADDPDLEVFVAESAGDPRRLAGELWDLDGWAARAEQLQMGLAGSPTAGPDDLAPGFELSASVLRHLQADPLLPAELLPPAWPGAALRRAYDRWDNRYREVLRAWGRAR
jgi:phenylacetic acid degradation operon negative regulatory protein